MEIRDYVRLHRRHFVRMSAIPAVFGIAAFALILAQPQEFLASVEFTVVPPDERTLSANDLGQYEANLTRTLESEGARTEVSSAAGLPLDDVEGLSAHQIGRSNRMEVAYLHREEAKARAGAVAAARAGVALLAAPLEAAVDDAATMLGEATQQRDAALAAIDAFTQETGLVLPEDQYQSAASQIRVLEDEARQAAGLGNLVRAEILDELVVQRRQEVNDLGAQVLRFQGLADDVRSAESPVREAETALEEAEARRDRVMASVEALPPEVQAVSELSRAATGAGVSAGIGGLLAAGLVARALSRSSDEQGDTGDRYYRELEPHPLGALPRAEQDTGASGLPERRQPFERVWPR